MWYHSGKPYPARVLFEVQKMAKKMLLCFTNFSNKIFCILLVIAFALSVFVWPNLVKCCCHKRHKNYPCKICTKMLVNLPPDCSTEGSNPASCSLTQGENDREKKIPLLNDEPQGSSQLS
jgi:hypothetical protein